MAVQFSIQRLVSDGTLSTVVLGIQYLQRNDIYIRIAGEETPQSGAPSGYTWSFLDNTTLKILPVVPNGVEVVVYRRTDVDAMYNIYSQNAQFDEATIDENNQQLLYIAQEYLEQGLPGAGVDTIEFLRDDGTNTYYRIKRTDGSYSEEFSVPSAGSITKVLAREALRRSYAEAGYNLVDGSFEAGGTLVNANDVLLFEADGKAYSWGGVLSKAVPAGSTPSSSGGIGPTTWIDQSAAKNSFTQSGAGAVERTLQDKLRDIVSVKDFGAVGDGSDETVKLQQAALVAAGRTLLFEAGKVYRLTEELVAADGTTFNLNNSTLRFACVGPKRNLAVGSNCQIINGTVENVVGTTGQEGTLQTPIVLGRYTSLAGVENVLLQNLTVSTVLPGGNGIAIFGDSHNLTIQNIKFPSSATIGIPILLHWSFTEYGSPPYTGITTHPHNVKIDNIWAGDLTYQQPGGDFNTALIFLSACRNVSISNIFINSFPFGKFVTVYAGDWGWQFATPIEQVMGATGIRIRGLAGRARTGVQVVNRNPLEAIRKVWPGEMCIEDACIFGNGDTGKGSGVAIDPGDNIRISRCVFDSFYNGISLGSDATNVRVSQNHIRNSYGSGVNALTGTGSGALTLEDNVFSSGNKSLAASIADVRIGNVFGAVIRGNTFSSPNVIWSVRAENTVVRLRLVDNHIAFTNSVGPAFSIGSSSDSGICIQYDGNTSAATPSAGVRGGQLIIPAVFSTKASASTALNIAYHSGIPDRGTWALGDRVYNSNPVVGQPKSWVCTVAGTPGTWVSEGVL